MARVPTGDRLAMLRSRVKGEYREVPTEDRGPQDRRVTARHAFMHYNVPGIRQTPDPHGDPGERQRSRLVPRGRLRPAWTGRRPVSRFNSPTTARAFWPSAPLAC